MGTLLPNRHPNRDFFILDVADAAPKDDLASMEHPVFSLSVKPDMRELEYEHNGRRLRVVPSGKGLATIMDKDILLYCISKLVHAKNAGEEITPWVEMSAHEVMVSTNRRTTTRSYQRFEEALIRLKGTVLLTDIATDGHMQTRGFGLIDEFEVNRKNAKGELSPFGRMTQIRVKVSDWTFRAVQGMEVLTINPLYFRLRRPLERRIYELARKHVGDQNHPFIINIAVLQKKVGSHSPEKKFRFFLKQIAVDGHIPDYDIALAVRKQFLRGALQPRCAAYRRQVGCAKVSLICSKQASKCRLRLSRRPANWRLATMSTRSITNGRLSRSSRQSRHATPWRRFLAFAGAAMPRLHLGDAVVGVRRRAKESEIQLSVPRTGAGDAPAISCLRHCASLPQHDVGDVCWLESHIPGPFPEAACSVHQKDPFGQGVSLGLVLRAVRTLDLKRERHAVVQPHDEVRNVLKPMIRCLPVSEIIYGWSGCLEWILASSPNQSIHRAMTSLTSLFALSCSRPRQLR